MSELHRISTNVSDRVADVLFLHGLGGDAFSTWRCGKDQSSSWPHWLAEEFPDVRFWSLHYAASPTNRARGFRKWFSGNRDAGDAMPLPDRAREVVDLMVQHQIGSRPLLLIGHSLGGLLAKQILRRANDDTRDDHHCILTNTKAVLFLGTPHQGASLASLADRFRVIIGPTASLEDLKAHDAHLGDLYDWYRNHSQKVGIETFTYFETKELAGFRIVDRTTSHPGVGPDPVGLDEDHISIAKPRERNQHVVNKARELVTLITRSGLESYREGNGSSEHRIEILGREDRDVDGPLGEDTAFDAWVNFAVDQFLEEFNRLSKNTKSMVCRALVIEFRKSRDTVRADVMEFFRTHSSSETQDPDAISDALERIDELNERSGHETQKILMNMQNWLMTTLVCPNDNPDIAVIGDNCDGVLFVGHPVGAELLFSVADLRRPDFMNNDRGEIVGRHLLNLSNAPIGNPDPLVLIRHFLGEVAECVGVITFNNQVVDEHDHGRSIRFWTEQLSLSFDAMRIRTGSRFYCCCPLPTDSGRNAKMISMLRQVGDEITDLGVFRLDGNRWTLSAEDIVVPLLRKRFKRIL